MTKKISANWGWVAGLVLAFLPAILLGTLIDRHAVNVPVWDDWEMVPYIEKAKEGTLTFSDLYAPHIEHRMVFPRLILIGLTLLGDGDLRWAISFTYVMGLVAGLGVWQLARRTIGEGKTTPAVLGLVFVANVLIFSPLQWQNWLWPIQVAFMTPMACLVWSLVVVIDRRLSWWCRLLMVAGLAIVGTHSFSHGLFIWPTVLGMALLLPRFGSLGWHRWAFLGVWLCLAGAIIGCYFGLDFKNTSDASHAYFQAPGEDPPMMKSLEAAKENPDKVKQFFLTMLGNPLSRGYGSDPLLIAPKVGYWILGIFVVTVVVIVVRWKREALWERALPWLALVGAVISIDVAVTLARVGFGALNRATVIRYVSISLYLLVALIFLVGVIAMSIRKPWWMRYRGMIGTALMAGFVGTQLAPWLYGADMMKLWQYARIEQQAQLIFIEKLEIENPWRIDATVAFPRRHIRTLDRYGYLEINLAESLELRQFKPHQKPMAPSRGKVEVFEKTPEEDGKIRIAGYACVNNDRPRPADTVLLTWERDGSDPMIFALAEDAPNVLPRQYHFDLEFTGRVSGDPVDYFRWEKRFSRDLIPGEGAVTVKAWAFNVDTRRAYRIAGEWTVE